MGNINVSTARTKAYANERRTMDNERYPKQTQSKPISNAERACPEYPACPVCQTSDSCDPGVLPMRVWLIFLACWNPLGNSLLRSDVILSDSEESGLWVESIFRWGTDFSFATQMLRPQGTQHDTGRLVCQKVISHPAMTRGGKQDGLRLWICDLQLGPVHRYCQPM